jgi:hypothetical protein
VNRKLTVRDEVENQTLTINDPRATVKIGWQLIQTQL